MLCPWGVGYVVGSCNVQCTCYTEHDRYDLSCLCAETVESMSSAGSVWHMVCMVYGCEILLLLDMVDMN